MWHFRIWFSRNGGVGRMVGLDDLGGLLHPVTLWFFSPSSISLPLLPLPALSAGPKVRQLIIFLAINKGLLEGFVICVLGLSGSNKLPPKLVTQANALPSCFTKRAPVPARLLHAGFSPKHVKYSLKGEKKSFYGAVIAQWRPQTGMSRTL